MTSGRGRSAAVSGPRARLAVAAVCVVDALLATGMFAGLASVGIAAGVDASVGSSVAGADAAVLPRSRRCVRAAVFLAVLLTFAEVFVVGFGFFAIMGFLRRQSVGSVPLAGAAKTGCSTMPASGGRVSTREQGRFIHSSASVDIGSLPLPIPLPPNKAASELKTSR